MTKIKAYIVYGGYPNNYSASLIFENGWCAFGHFCSSPGYMPGDLWLNRPERQNALKKMGYEVELHPEIFAGSDASPAWLLEAHKNEAGWKAMSEAYNNLEEPK